MARNKLPKMTESQILEEIESNNDRRDILFEKKYPIDKELESIYDRNQELGDMIAKIREENIKKSGKIDWEWLLHTTHSESSMEKYHLRQKTLADINLSSSGFFPATEQSSISVRLIKNDPDSLEKTLLGLDKVLEHIKPLPDDGCKRIDIMERTLSEYGVYFLTIDDSDDPFKVKKTTYHRTETLSKYKTLREALEVIQNKYYYEDANRKEDEDEDDAAVDWHGTW